MLGKYKVIHLIGSTKGNERIFKNAEKYFTRKGYIVFKLVFYKLKEYTPYMDLVNDMCYEKLLACDMVCVVNPNHIGNSTLNRIKQAQELGKDVIIFDGKVEMKFADLEGELK